MGPLRRRLSATGKCLRLSRRDVLADIVCRKPRLAGSGREDVGDVTAPSPILYYLGNSIPLERTLPRTA